MARTTTHLLLALATALAVAACGTTKSEQRYSKAQAAAALARFETVGLELGEFSIDGDTAAIDGDTVRVKGLKSSMRLIGIDTEEIVHKAYERQAMETLTWPEYVKKMKGSSSRPVKMASPLGYDAWKFAQDFLRGASKVKLERDHPGEIRDFYGRYLAYVFVQKNGKWVNYNIECVRAGMSPYFSKYAYSRRFHNEFVQAQEEARAAARGIWDPNKKHYPDYDERLKWWNERADVIAAFEKEAEERDDFIVLTRWDSLKRLDKRVGQEVVILGAVGEVRLGDGGPAVVKLAKTRSASFDVVFFDKDILTSSGINKAKGEYVRVKGTVRKYKDKYRGSEKLQIIVNAPGQILMPDEKMDEWIASTNVPEQPAPKVVVVADPKAPADPKAEPNKTDPGELPEVPNKTVEPKGKKKGPLDLGDVSEDLDFGTLEADGPDF